MTGIRNGVLAHTKTSAAGRTLLGTVPAGTTWLIKSIVVLNQGTQPATVVPQLQTGDQAHLVYLFNESLTANLHFLWEGWVAADPGHQLYGYSDQANIQWWVSGAELPGVRPAPI